jgi:hypothetical protein
MSACPRCGTCLLPAATVCTACCHPLTDTSPEPHLATIEVAAPAPADTVPAAAAGAPDQGPVARELLMHWPFGAVDDETVRTVAEADAPEARSQLSRAANTASSSVNAGVRIPDQRSASARTLRISVTPPSNTYAAAERRQQPHYGTTDTHAASA